MVDVVLSTPNPSDRLWSLVLGPGTIDRGELALAIELAVSEPQPDFRTRVLLRDASRAVADPSPFRPETAARLRELAGGDLGDRGFTTLGRRVVEHTKPATIEQFFRELGRLTREPCRLDVGGSCALLLADVLRRRTDDVDAVDEVPAVLRNQHAALADLAARYDLRLAHFQSHYLPEGWRNRAHSFGVYGSLYVNLVDPLDVLVGKLFSRRTKDLDDLRIALPIVGKEAFTDRLRAAGQRMLAEPRDRANAEANWYVLFGEDALPA